MLTIFSQTLRRGKFTTNMELKAFANIRPSRAKAKAALILSWAAVADLMISSVASLMAAVAAVLEHFTGEIEQIPFRSLSLSLFLSLSLSFFLSLAYAQSKTCFPLSLSFIRFFLFPAREH